MTNADLCEKIKKLATCQPDKIFFIDYCLKRNEDDRGIVADEYCDEMKESLLKVKNDLLKAECL